MEPSKLKLNQKEKKNNLLKKKYFLIALILLLFLGLIGATLITVRVLNPGIKTSNNSDQNSGEVNNESTPTPTSSEGVDSTVTPEQTLEPTTPTETTASPTSNPTTTVKTTPKPTAVPTQPPAPTQPPVASSICPAPNKTASSIASLADLVKNAVPGDHIRLTASVTGTITLSFPSGTAAQNICLSYAPGVVSTGLFRANNPRYVVMENMRVTWRVGDGAGEHMFKVTGGNRWIVRNSEIWGAQSYANMLITGGALNFQIVGNYIHDVAHLSAVNSTVQNHNIYLAQGDYGLIAGNRIVNAPRGRCIKVANASADNPDQPNNNQIIYNTMRGCYGPSIAGVSYNAANNEFRRNIFITGPCIMNVNDITGAGNKMNDNIYWNITGDCLVSDTANFTYSAMYKVNPALNASDVPTNAAAAGYGYKAYKP